MGPCWFVQGEAEPKVQRGWGALWLLVPAWGAALGSLPRGQQCDHTGSPSHCQGLWREAGTKPHPPSAGTRSGEAKLKIPPSSGGCSLLPPL